MQAIAIGHLALRHSMSWDEVPSIRIDFDGEQVIEGSATAFTNSAIEAAIIHCRALLEFLGLAGKSQTELKERQGRGYADDHGIEHFGGLPKLTIGKAVSVYPGPKAEAEAALAYVAYLANKGLAHTTSSFSKHDQDAHLVEIAFRGVPQLVINNFYVPLGLEPPNYKLPSRPRAA
jgi:hypothetical protein